MKSDVMATTMPQRPQMSANSESTASDTLTAVSQRSHRGGGGMVGDDSSVGSMRVTIVQFDACRRSEM